MNLVTVIVLLDDIGYALNGCIDTMKLIKEKCHSVVFVYSDEIPIDKFKKEFCGLKNVSYYKYNCQTEWAKVFNCLSKIEEYKNNDILILNADVVITEKTLHTMQKDLYAVEKHGLVCPRMNCGKFIAIPRLTDARFNHGHAYSVWQKAYNLLPDYTIIPWGNTSCMLIKREVVDLLGLFDESLASVHNAVIDFCIRISNYGYSSIISNQSFAYCESSCDGHMSHKLENKILKRYPRLAELEQQYIDKLNPIEHFAELFNDSDEKKRILLNICSLTPFYSGTAEYQKNLLKEFCYLYSDKYEIYILVNEEADKFHNISCQYKNVFHPETLKGVFHIGLFAAQIVNVDDIKFMNRYCLRYVFTLQDIIFLRRSYISIRENARVDNVLRMSMKYADGIIGISGYSIQDALSYFGRNIWGEDLVSKMRVIYDAVETKRTVENEPNNTPFNGEYILIFGRDSHYKFIEEVLDIAIEMQNINFVFVGLGNKKDSYNNIKCYPSGHLSEDMIVSLYENAVMVIFPSLYEGFGIPVFDAFKYGKKIIVKNNELNREILSSFKAAYEYMLLYRDLNDLRALISSVVHNKTILDGYHARSWRDVAMETEGFLDEILNQPININRLNERWYCVSNLKSIFGDNSIGTKEFLKVVKMYFEARISKFKSSLGIKLYQ